MRRPAVLRRLLPSSLVIGAVVLHVTAASAAAPDQQEDICNSSSVIACDNFESRGVGPLVGARFKSPGWNAGAYGVSNGPSAAGGAHVLRTQYWPSGTRAELPLSGNHTTLYFRWFTMRTGYVTPSNFSYEALFSFGTVFGGFVNHPVAVSAGGTFTPGEAFSFPTDSTDGLLKRANMNGPVTFADGRWYCVEARITANSGPTTNDGYLQAWVDETQHWEYPGINFTNGGMTGPFTKFAFYNQYTSRTFPTSVLARQHDNVVVSTNRIHCDTSTSVVDAGVDARKDAGAADAAEAGVSGDDASAAPSGGQPPLGPEGSSTPDANADPSSADGTGEGDGCAVGSTLARDLFPSTGGAALMMSVIAFVVRARQRRRSADASRRRR